MGKRNPNWHGRVPAFVVKDGTLSRSARLLYADLCCHADDDTDVCRRSVRRVAEQEGVSRRTVQRWLFELEAAGLIVKLNDVGKMGCFRVIRHADKANSARVTNLRNCVERRARYGEYGRKGAAKRAEKHTQDAEGVTPMSPPRDTDVTGTGVTPMSPEHSHHQHTRGTEEGGSPADTLPAPVAPPPERAGSGLRNIGDCLQGGGSRIGGESLALARKAVADRAGGWSSVIELPDSVVDDLASRHLKGTLTDTEIQAAVNG